MPETEEEADAQLVTSGNWCDDLGLAEVYRRHGGAVYGLARGVLRNETEAEDVAQEVFVRLWTQPQRFDPNRGNLRSFLLAQSHARAIDAIRALEARQRREGRDHRCATIAEADTPQAVWRQVVSIQLRRALGLLPEDERRAIELAYFDGYTYLEVAALLDQPEGTIKSRIRNGMRRMKSVLSEAGIEGTDA